MTGKEVNQRYNVPLEILRQYNVWRFQGEDAAFQTEQYEIADLDRLSLMMALYGVGFSSEEVKEYLSLLQGGNETKLQRMCMLSQRRSTLLEEIHLREKQISRLDYMQHEIQTASSETL